MVSILHCALIVITNGMRAIFAAACPGVFLRHMRRAEFRGPRSEGMPWCANSLIGRVQRAEIRGHAGGQSGTWRKPRRLEHPPANGASSSSGGNPVKLELISKEQAEVRPNGARKIDESTALDSDESDTSIEYGTLRVRIPAMDQIPSSILYEVEVNDELADAVSQVSDEGAVTEREQVSKWRMDNLLQDDLDFAYVYADFEEACSYAGEAVARAWSRARSLAKPEMVSDMAKINAVEATATQVRKVDERRKAAVTMKEKTADAPFLR